MTINHTEFRAQLNRFLAGRTDISAGEIEKIVSSFRPSEVKKNEILLQEGKPCNSLYYIHQGCLRTYYLTAHGSEKTRHIGFEGSLITSLASFINDTPSFEWLDAPEPSVVFAISRNVFFDLVEEIPAWHTVYRKFIEQAYTRQAGRTESLVALSAKQRYEKLLVEEPMFVKRLPNKVLASYLDVTPETLSRLKAK